MSRAEDKRGGAGRAAGALAVAVALLCLGGLLTWASAARAAFEEVGCFAGTGETSEQCKPVKEEKFGEEVQLGGLGGMAVNYTGAGGVGVPMGTVYAATGTLSQPSGVVMFEPKPGGLKFEEAWTVPSEEGKPYTRCGPLLGVNGKGEAEHPCPTRVGAEPRSTDVEVNEETGEVLVDYGPSEAGRKAIVAFKADGSEELGRFGELAPFSEKIQESPGEIHGGGSEGMLAVGKGGEVFVFDEDSEAHHRLMGFKRKGAGKYEYAAGEDVGAGSAHRPTMPVADAAGRLYVASGSTFIEAYDPAHPAAGPICTYEYKQGGITALTMNPLNGDVFFYSFRIAKGFKGKTVHELGPCNEGTGHFEGPKGEEEVGQVEVKPERAEVTGLALDPQREFSASRPAWTLYGGAPGSVPPLGLGEGEKGQASLGYAFAPGVVKEAPPAISGEAVSRVRVSTASLRATLDPNAFDTRYAFEYETEAEWEEDHEAFGEGAEEAPAGGAEVPGGSGSRAVGAVLSGLFPETEYRYRLVATSHGCPEKPEELCFVEGEARRLRTYPATPAGPPDSRAYELVSPSQKQGGQVLPADPRVSSCGLIECKPGNTWSRLPMQSAPDGEAVAYEGTSFGYGGTALANSYIAHRSPTTGWQSVNPTPGLLLGKGASGYKAFTPDLTEGVLSQEQLRPALSPEAPEEFEGLYSQPTVSPFAVRPLLTAQPTNRGKGEFALRYAGASADLSRVFFAANDALTGPTGSAPEALDGGPSKFNLYEWEWSDEARTSGQLRLVNVAPGNASAEPGAFFGAAGAHAISANGSRVFFSDEAGQLFVREGHEATREIPGSGPGAGFLAAAADGSQVLLGNGSLYELKEGKSTDLTSGKGGFVGLVGQSEDLTHLYFVDSQVLTGSEESCREGVWGEEVCETAQPTKDNLYSWEAGATRFVATLEVGDDSISPGGDWKPIPSARTAEASPDGRYLAFLSKAPLTRFDNVGPCELVGETGEFVPGPCSQVFLFDSQSGELSCPSCNRSGSSPLGHSTLRLVEASEGSQWNPQARYLTDSGRLYFDSQDSLSPNDTNEGVEDVYEFEPQEAGSCKQAAGCVSLVSAGSGSADSNFMAADPAGKDVFFTTRDRLTAADGDDLIDLYDAREPHVPGEVVAFPFESELAPGPCQGEGCQVPAPAAAEAPPASATFSGPGNTKPARCKKGQVSKSGKCVAKHKQHGKKKKPRAAKKGGSQ